MDDATTKEKLKTVEGIKSLIYDLPNMSLEEKLDVYKLSRESVPEDVMLNFLRNTFNAMQKKQTEDLK